MPRITSRDKRRRDYPGEREGLIVATFLNNQPEQRRKEIRNLLDLLRSLLTSGRYRAGRLIPRPEKIDEDIEKVEAFNRQAEKYRPAYMFLQGSSPADPFPPSNLFTWRLEEVAKSDIDGAALNLIDLARMGLLDSLRQCDYEKCRKWFFARFSHQHFCPDGDCRNQFNKNSPQAKKRRSEKSLAYYWDTLHPQRYRYPDLTWQQFRQKMLSSKRKKSGSAR